MYTNEEIWDRINPEDRVKLIRLRLSGDRIKSIRTARSAGGLGLTEARDFVDSPWFLHKVLSADPTRMTPKQELASEILCVLGSLSKTTCDEDMSVEEKYQWIIDNHIPMLFALCMED